MLKIAKFIAHNATVVNITGSRLARTSNRFYAQTGSVEDKNITTRDSDEPIDITNPFEKDPQQCILCKNNITPHYKNVRLLSQFQSSYTGRIYGRHITGLCKQKQDDVERAILRAQQCLLMPGYHKDLDFLQDPKLFDPERPVRPHKY
ncbi:28S ribosomal protein S18c, mitochondrial [Drosophila guanche]|uniref:Blast:28S ribosomal protein S18c, mitochondrial n=1 Tax=Drosophila guanche TaxID=7266 RepID=A0A3B0JCI8_DROGU|nr:28S ribosomal protein S18c, mitochondrial [Drosophila guanche]SPP80084.1 blast:28S ribosomal protein S18c%2C mitochondrial [Drosophila guanche]